MKKFTYSGKSERLLNCIGDDQIRLTIAIASSEEENEHAILALACNDELDNWVYLDPSQVEILIKQLQVMRTKLNKVNYDILTSEEPINI